MSRESIRIPLYSHCYGNLEVAALRLNLAAKRPERIRVSVCTMYHYYPSVHFTNRPVGAEWRAFAPTVRRPSRQRSASSIIHYATTLSFIRLSIRNPSVYVGVTAFGAHYPVRHIPRVCVKSLM